MSDLLLIACLVHPRFFGGDGHSGDGFAARGVEHFRVAPEATDDEVRRAGQLANLDDFVQSLPEGYQTVVQEGGVNLSVGKRQLVCIARVALAECGAGARP